MLAHAEKTGNVAKTCRTFGISRTRYYQWRNLADQYGVDALTPKDRRRPQLPNATPTWVINELLSLTVAEPTIGCRQYADRSRTGATGSPSPPCRRSWSTTAWADEPNGWPEQLPSRP